MVCSSLLTNHSGANSYLSGGGISATFRHSSDVAYSCFVLFLLFLFCFSSGVLLHLCLFGGFLLHPLKYARFLVHVCRSVATRALTNCVPSFCFSFASFLFLLFPSKSIDVGATNGICIFSCFKMGFLKKW